MQQVICTKYKFRTLLKYCKLYLLCENVLSLHSIFLDASNISAAVVLVSVLRMLPEYCTKKKNCHVLNIYSNNTYLKYNKN